MQTTANQQTAGSRIQPSHQNQHTTNDALQTTGKNKPTATTAAITTTTTTAAAVGSMAEIEYVSHFHETQDTITTPTSGNKQQSALQASAGNKQQNNRQQQTSGNQPTANSKHLRE